MLSTPRNRFPWPLLLLACAAACLAVSSQSFWTDETETALKAAAPTFQAWWRLLYAEHDSNLQLPLYMLYVWTWARVVPVSEISLRAANIPWFFVGFFAIACFLRRRPGLRNAALLLYSINPFVWYYVDEARPYIMQLSGALLAAGALFEAIDGGELDRGWWWLYGVGITILCGSGLLGVPWAVSITVLMMGCERFRQTVFRQGRPALMVFGPILICLALYFAWTLKEGAHPGETRMDLKSIPFVFYEQLGFAGLGPGRDEMRGREFSLFLPYLPAFCALGLPLVYAFARGAAVRFGIPRARFAAICAGVLGPAGFVFVLGFTRHFLVLGRHLTPMFVFVLGGLAFAIWHLWSGKRLLDRGVVVLLVLALTGSALEYRFAYRHERDDNRDAAAIAKAALAQGDDVWWAADRDCAAYYGLPFADKQRAGSALIVWKPVPAWLATLNVPTLIVLSKPDIFDANGGLRQYLQQHGYMETESLPAFTLWKR
jgi:hypothetical protein